MRTLTLPLAFTFWLGADGVDGVEVSAATVAKLSLAATEAFCSTTAQYASPDPPNITSPITITCLSTMPVRSLALIT